MQKFSNTQEVCAKSYKKWLIFTFCKERLQKMLFPVKNLCISKNSCIFAANLLRVSSDAIIYEHKHR